MKILRFFLFGCTLFLFLSDALAQDERAAGERLRVRGVTLPPPTAVNKDQPKYDPVDLAKQMQKGNTAFNQEVSDLELEVLEAGYILQKDKGVQLKLIYNYKIRVQRLCPDGPESLAERAPPENLDQCAELISKILKLDPENIDAICSKSGSNSDDCLGMKPHDSADEDDAYSKIEKMLGTSQQSGTSTVGHSVPKSPHDFPVPASLRPLQDKIAEQSLELMRSGGSDEARNNLIKLHEQMVLKLCPNPATASKDTKPNEACTHYSGMLAALDPSNLLPGCFMAGFDSPNCTDYLNLTGSVRSQNAPSKSGSQSGGMDRF